MPKREISIPPCSLNMRLSPTMYSLKQQVGEANRHAVVAGALLAGRAPHTFSDTEPDIAELKSRISAAIDFVQGLPRAEIDAAADKEVAFTFKNGAQRKFTGKSLLLTFSVPQFFFHVTTAYDILRHAGVDIAKKDFLGPPTMIKRTARSRGIRELRPRPPFSAGPRLAARAASAHFALQLLEAPACVAFAIVDHLDRGVPVDIGPVTIGASNSRRWSRRHSSRHCRGAPST